MADVDMVTRLQVDDSVVGTTDIDESLYSRQLYVLGHEAMRRMGASNVLVVGLKGLGVEIAKNIALAGVKSLTLYDPQPTATADLSAQFFLRQEDVGKPRDQVTVPRVAELNAYVPVKRLESSGFGDDLSVFDGFQVVVLTNTPLKLQLAIGDYCHSKGIHVITADSFGLFGSIFCDFGKNFTVLDSTGENPQAGIIDAIDDEGIVSVHEDTRHGLEDGDFVTFTEVEGMEGLNGCAPRKITVKGPYTFSIGDVSGLGQYIRGGLYQQVKMPKFIDFKPISTALKEPEFLISDYAKFDRPQQLHLGFQALHAFQESQGRAPKPMDEADATVVLAAVRKFAAEAELEIDIDEKVIRELSFQATGDLNPMAAFLGGIAAQEALKAVSGKFNPIQQWLYFDSLEALPINSERSVELCQPTGSRYDGQIAVFGRDFQEKIANHNQFLVGAGAIGCEMLKNWAMVGLSTGSKGKIWVTDLDSIEKSNLNRQFLFRSGDVGKMKSNCAARAVQQMNPDLTGKIDSREDRVSKDTETVYNETFWQGLDGVTNALDNVEARQYVDQRCVLFLKPLLESGTLGTKGNTQVVLPRLTESYSSSADPPEKSFPMCTTKSFPNKIEHCIHWAKTEIFEVYFIETPTLVNQYLTQPDYVKGTLKRGDGLGELKRVRDGLLSDRPQSFEDCIAWARRKFEELFVNKIKQLLYSFPKDQISSSGAPFWSGPKRAPEPLKFDANNPSHLDFIIAGANLHAFNYNIKPPSDKDNKSSYLSVLDNVIVPDFSPDSKTKIATTENEAKEEAQNRDASDDELNEVLNGLPAATEFAGFEVTPIEFEKDDDSNHHIDFITVCSNLRADNYRITTIDRHQTKFIAGKIVPAIATTTSLVTGLVVLELFKIIDGKTDIEQYKNGFINLALPFFGFSEPIGSQKLEYQGREGKVKLDKIWDRFEVEDMKLRDFIKYFEDERGLEICMLSSGVSLLYASFQPPAVLAGKLDLMMSELVEKVSRTKIPEHQTEVIVAMVANDATGEDVDDLPFIKVKIR